MPSESPSLSLAIARLNPPTANHFATWVVDSPLPSGYVHHDCILPESLSQLWQAWLEMFSPESAPPSPGGTAAKLTLPPVSPHLGPKPSYSSRLMQHLGIHLWQWLFQGPLQNSFHRSQGIAIGLQSPLRIRLDVRDTDLIPLPWEIMQPQPGQPAISLNPLLLFSRTTCDVNPLSDRPVAQSLNILLVLGHNDLPPSQPTGKAIGFLPDHCPPLEIEGEAEELTRVLAGTHLSESDSRRDDRVSCIVKTLTRPSVAELIAELESRRESGQTPYNVLFYAGHGVPAPDGGLLFLQPDTAINGTELAQVLVRCGITLALFNTCWSAQPARERTPEVPLLAIPGSSLAKVLIHHGVPAVLGMRDAITDSEALSFIQVFARALSERMPIDRAVALARQHLLTLFKFNQPAWTLPVLYMHPQFDGELIEPASENQTELPPNSTTWMGYAVPRAWLRLCEGADVPPLPVEAGIVRIGRGEENDIVIREQWVSSKHAEIFYRNGNPETRDEPTYFLRDFSRYGTLVFDRQDWQRVHHQEVALRSGTRLKFGSSQGQVLEFIIETPPADP
ncbi:MAG: CHAT domain-containing protein [Limnospira sp.]